MKKKILSAVLLCTIILGLVSCKKTANKTDANALETYIKPFIGITQVKPDFMIESDTLTPDEVVEVYTYSKTLMGNNIKDTITSSEIEDYAKHFNLTIDDMKLSSYYQSNEDVFKKAESTNVLDSMKISDVSVINSEDKEISLLNSDKTATITTYEYKIESEIKLSTIYTYNATFTVSVLNTDDGFVLYGGETISSDAENKSN